MVLFGVAKQQLSLFFILILTDIAVVRHCANEIENPLASAALREAREQRRELQPLRGGQKFDHGAFGLSQISVVSMIGQPFEKMRDRGLESSTDLIELGGADPVKPALIFLDLLKRQPEVLRQPMLTEAEKFAAQTNAAADMEVDRLGLVSGF